MCIIVELINLTIWSLQRDDPGNLPELKPLTKAEIKELLSRDRDFMTASGTEISTNPRNNSRPIRRNYYIHEICIVLTFSSSQAGRQTTSLLKMMKMMVRDQQFSIYSLFFIHFQQASSSWVHRAKRFLHRKPARAFLHLMQLHLPRSILTPEDIKTAELLLEVLWYLRRRKSVCRTWYLCSFFFMHSRLIEL